MKKILLIAAIAAGWFVYHQMKEMATPEKIRDSAPVRYTTSLQQDVKQARQVQEKANQKIQEINKQVQEGLEQAAR